MISIIGAGPAGSYLGFLLARAGKDVHIFEEHEEVGAPVQCTGIVTDSVRNFIRPKRAVIANYMDTVHVNSQNHQIEAKTDEIVLWRNKFDQQVADIAADAGAHIHTNHQYIDRPGKFSIRVKDKTRNITKTIPTEVIIGADGPSSQVAKTCGLESKSEFYIGMQAKVELKTEKNVFQTYFGTDYPDFFGWVVPESDDTVRLGIGCKKDAKTYFYKFLEKVTGKTDVKCWESGIIPIYDPKKQIQKDNVYLIGDAATQVKATTGGGIIPSFKAAHTLADCITKKKPYQRSFKFGSGKELLVHLKLRNILNKFTDTDYDHLLELMNQDKVRRCLKKYDRDQPIQLLSSLLMSEPKFLKYAKFVF